MRVQAVSVRSQDIDRREEILLTARDLFSRHGFAKVSLRDIAGELGISVGNLTYYFPRKADLVDAVLDEFRRASLPEGHAPEDLGELVEFLLLYEQLIEEKVLQLHECPPVTEGSHMATLQTKAAKQLSQLWGQILENLTAAGLITAPAYPGQHEDLSTTLQMIFRHWVSFARTEAVIGHAHSVRASIWAILYPYLTEAGKNALQVYL